jgi:hypothetical protein
MKMLRLLRANRMFSRLEAKVAVDYSQLQLYAYLAVLLLLMHWLACGCELSPLMGHPHLRHTRFAIDCRRWVCWPRYICATDQVAADPSTRTPFIHRLHPALTPLYAARRGRWYMIITVELNVECVVLEDTRYADSLKASGDMTPSWGCCFNWLDCYRYAHFNRQTSNIEEASGEQQSKARQCVPTAAHLQGGCRCRGTGTTRRRERQREDGS